MGQDMRRCLTLTQPAHRPESATWRAGSGSTAARSADGSPVTCYPPRSTPARPVDRGRPPGLVLGARHRSAAQVMRRCGGL